MDTGSERKWPWLRALQLEIQLPTEELHREKAPHRDILHLSCLSRAAVSGGQEPLPEAGPDCEACSHSRHQQRQGSLLHREPRPAQFLAPPGRSEQFVARAAPDDGAILDHEDLVCAADGVQAVGDHHRRLSLERLAEAACAAASEVASRAAVASSRVTTRGWASRSHATVIR